MDIPWASEAAKRLHAILPPEVKAAEKAPKGFVPASQLQQAMDMFEQAKAANTQIQEQMQARIVALEGELKNQIQGRIAAERIKGEYGLAEVQIKEMNANQREAMKVQADVEKSSAKIQTDLIREVGARARDAAKASSDIAREQKYGNGAVQGPAQSVQRSGPMTMEFKGPAIGDGRMTNEEMLMNLR